MELPLLKDSLYSEITSLKLHIAKKNPELEFSLLRYHRKLNQCNLIISRIQSEQKQYQLLDEKVRSTVNQTSGIRKLTHEESLLHHEQMTISSTVNFDIEDFFIHAKILLDRLLQILIHFLNDLPSDTKKDFSKHRLYLLKKDCSDKEYVQYIREKTKWFPLLLSVFRNDLVVHDKITSFTGTIRSLDGSKHTIIRSRHPSENQHNEIMSQLNKIKESHKGDIPSVQNEDNIWQILEKLDQYTENLTHEEVKTLFNIRQQIGGEFPDVKEVIMKIQEFLDFVNSHFTQNDSSVMREILEK